MEATKLLARSAMRGRWRSHLALVVLLIIGVGTALASLTAAFRTDHEYTDFLQRSKVSQLVINPLLVTDRLLDLVRTTPGVESVSMSRFLNLNTDDIDQQKQNEFGAVTQPIGAVDGRYFDVDRPKIVEGRMIAAKDEIFINRAAAAAYGLHVGEQLTVTFIPAQPTDVPPDPNLPPLGSEKVTVVGIGVFADEVLPDDLYPKLRIIFSPEISAQYSCITKQPGPDDQRSLDELRALFFPTNCSSDATLLAVRVAGGDAGVQAVLAALDERVAAENAKLPATLRDQNFGFQVIPTVSSAETERVRHSVEPVVLALRLLGLAVLLATVVLAVATAHRIARSTDSDAQIWSQLGVARAQRMVAVAAPTAVAIAAALGGALIAGWLASGIGPVASVKVLDPSPALGMPAIVMLAVVPVTLVVLLALLTLSTWRATSGSARSTGREGTNRIADAAAKTGDVALALGVHAAVRGRRRRGSGLLLGAAIVAVAVGTSALIYSTNLVALVSDPPHYGWTYDIGATINAGFDGAQVDAIASALDRPEVTGWGVAATALSATIGDVKLPVIADIRGMADLPLTVLHGVLPRNDHEVALGSTSANRIGVSVGDHVSVATDFGTRDAVVTGIVVMPAIGTFLADRAGLGTGIMLSAPFFKAIASAAESAAGLDPGTIYDTAGTFVAINLRRGVDPAAFTTTIGRDASGWDTLDQSPTFHVAAVRPAQIADIASVKSAPLLLAGLIALTIAIGLAASLGRAVRSRRRELAVLQAIGCKRSQLYATVCWQGLTVVLIGLVIGIPLGAIAGSALWRGFASDLGIRPAANVPWTWVSLGGGAAIVVALLAALVSGRAAASERPAVTLRET
jgi:FtsX-like permease family